MPATNIAIIGAGSVGATTAYAATLKNLAAQITLIDINDKKEKGEVMDLTDGLCFVETGNIKAGTFTDAQTADIIVITAGIAQNKDKPQSRLGLVKTNTKILKSIFKNIGKLKSSAIIILVTNPVDALTYAAQEITKLPHNQVFGTGTALDTARLKSTLAKRFNIDSHNVHGYVMGEHGDSSFVAWSTVSIGGIPANKIKSLTAAKMKHTEQQVQKEAYQIIAKKGATYYGIATTITNILEAIIYDQHLILPVSARLERYNGVNNICLGAPAVIGKNGIERLWPVALSAKEKRALKKSAKVVNQAIGKK